MPTPTAKNTIVGTNLYGKVTKWSESISTTAPANNDPVIKNNIGTAMFIRCFALIINQIVNGNNPIRNKLYD